MEPKIKNLFLNNQSLKVISLILGFGFWYFFSQSRVIEYSTTVPCCFYNKPETYTINSIEKLRITLQGVKSDFYSLDMQNLGLHINCSQLHVGENIIPVTQSLLFLPQQFKLIHCTPPNITIMIHT